ncbi:MAG: TolC family protein, partial [Candidatus Paceibacterales bacterium]
MKSRVFRNRRFTFVITTLLIVIFQSAAAQKTNSTDTLVLTAADAEQAFLSNNFMLLAQKYEVSVADAGIIQAKLYPNLNFSIDQGVYNPDNKKWFDFTKTGETAISLQQVILLAGKRNNAVKMATISSKISKYQFYDLIRTLRYELKSSFYDLYFLRQSA